MSSHDHREEKLFEHCLGLPPEEREAYLREQRPDDPDLVESVLALLRSHESAGKFLDELPTQDSFEVASRLERVAPTEERPGDQIGRYRLLELIGEGAWGTVWIARQTEDIDRQVAIKILKVGMDTKDFLARFEAERQMLAMMDHPNIAKVLDAGATKRGRPYLVMELVKGIQILEFADKNRLEIRERVELFAKVCRALHHAHRKGVVHRDLKPSNILVSAQYDEALPKVIDFGVAKSNQLRLSDKTLFTSMHTFMGTPVYSSPEQLEFTGRDVDARSDIYSLGALLYELVCGATPYDNEALAKEGMAEFVRRVREEDPARPSQRFAGLPEEEKDRIASRRQLSPGELESLLKSDLDWVALKCLAKDPSRRYDTAKDLADDLQAYLRNEVVVATEPSFGYRIRKTMTPRRVASIALLGIPTLIFGSLALFFYFRSDDVSSQLEIKQDSSIHFTEKSVAVLPLENQSPDPENAFFAGGVQEDILMNMAKIKELFVISRSSTMRYSDPNRDIQRIGEELGVRYVAEGSVRRIGDRVRVSIRLSDARTGGQLWAENYNRELTDIFAIQSDVAKQIAVQLHAVISPRETELIDRRPTENQEAYDLFVKTRDAQTIRQIQGDKVAMLKRAVELDPEFAEAWAQLAIESIYGWNAMSTRQDDDLYKQAHHALEQARIHGSNIAYYPFAQASFASHEHKDTEGSIGFLLEALDRDPGFYPAKRSLGARYVQLGRLDEAQQSVKEALRSDPHSNRYKGALVGIYELKREWDNAKAVSDGVLNDSPADPYWLLVSAQTEYRRSGDLNSHIRARSKISGYLGLNEFQYDQALLERDFRAALFVSEGSGTVGNNQVIFSPRRNSTIRIAPSELEIALAHFVLGDPEGIIREVSKARGILGKIVEKDPENNPTYWAGLAVAYALERNREKMEEAIVKARRVSQMKIWKYLYEGMVEAYIAIAHIVLGDNEAAIDTLENAVKLGGAIQFERELDRHFIFDRLRGNPRFDALIGKGEGLRSEVEPSVIPEEADQPFPDKSIAVLPLENMSPDPDDAYFADGVHGTILADLANVGELRVVSRTSVLPYRGSEKSIKVIGEELGVAHILEGSMQRSGNRFRLNAQLIDTERDQHLWAETYDGELSDVFAVQSQLAREVVRALQAVLSPQEAELLDRAVSASAEAYDRFLKLNIRGQIIGPGEAGFRRLEQLDEILNIDPFFTDALIEKSRVCGTIFSQGVDRSSDMDRMAKDAIDNAFALEPNNPDVLLGVALYHYDFQKNWSRARYYADQVVKLYPNKSEGHGFLARIYRKEGKWAESMRHAYHAVELDPTNLVNLTTIGANFLRLRLWDNVFQNMEAFLNFSMNEQVWNTLNARMHFYASGSLKEGNRLYGTARSHGDININYLSWLYEVGDLEAFNERGIIEEWGSTGYMAPFGRGFTAWRQVIVLQSLGERKQAESLAKKIIETVADREETTYEDYRGLIAKGLAHAILGKIGEARNSVDQAVVMLPETLDSALGARLAVERATVLAWMDKKDEAVVELNRLAQMPGAEIHYHYLKNCLDFLPLRDHPGFLEILNDPALQLPIPLADL